MAQLLKQSTAATIPLGPFVDDTDGKTAETGLTISQADIRISKNGGDFAQSNNSAGATHDESGYYDVPLDTTDTNTLGRLRVAVSESGALPVWQDFLVVPANVYDALVSGSDYLDVSLVQWLGTAPLALASQLVQADAIKLNGATPNNLAAGAAMTLTATYDPAKSDVITPLAVVDGIVDAIKAKTDNLPSDPADESAIEAAITAATSTLATATNLAAAKAVVDAIKAKTDNLPSDPADESSLEAAITAATSTLATATNLAAAKVVVDAIKAKTDNLPSDPADESSLEAAITAAVSALATAANLAAAKAVVDAIKAKTDNLPTDPADESSLEAAIAAAQSTLEVVIAQSEANIRGADNDDLKDISDEIGILYGGGPIEKEVSVTDGSNPLEGATVWLTSDEAGENTVASGTTDAFGNVTFYLDAGTYWAWKKLAGYKFTNPEEMAVS